MTGAPTAAKDRFGIVRRVDGPLPLVIGTEGGHVYRFAPASMGRDLTMPGGTEWHGFADTGGTQRSESYALEIVGQDPVGLHVLARAESGARKEFRFYHGEEWYEVFVDPPTGFYWDYDDPALWSEGGRSRGKYLFEDGTTGELPPPGAPAGVFRGGVRWGLKVRDDGLCVLLITPEVRTRHGVGPGGNAGGVGIEGSAPVAHFVTFAGKLPAGEEPAAFAKRLTELTDLRRMPAVK